VEEVPPPAPDIVVTDVTMPGMSGIDAMRRLKAEGSEARFIFLTIHTEARLAAEAMRSGASAYLLKQAAGNELFDAIQAVQQADTYLTP
jgi:DNA-binding NarL/FixJ family response regulator